MLFGISGRVPVFISYNADGSVAGIHSHGHEQRAKESTELPYYGAATVDAPEEGVTFIYLREPAESA